MVIKGQNLRVMVGNPAKCVAAAVSCQVHLVLQLEDTSTKDSTGGWQEQEPVGKSWDGTVDALVTDGIYDAKTNIRTDNEVSDDVYESAESFVLQPGQTIWVSGVSGVNVGMNDNHSSPLAPMLGNTADYTNNSSTAMNIYLLSDTLGAKLDAYITDGERATCAELLTAYFAGTAINIRFSTTTGRNNIVEDEALLQGMAYINDLQLTAQNRTSGQFTMSFTGTGELERVEN